MSLIKKISTLSESRMRMSFFNNKSLYGFKMNCLKQDVLVPFYVLNIVYEIFSCYNRI